MKFCIPAVLWVGLVFSGGDQILGVSHSWRFV